MDLSAYPPPDPSTLGKLAHQRHSLGYWMIAAAGFATFAVFAAFSLLGHPLV
jgi:hypothetical protein